VGTVRNSQGSEFLTVKRAVWPAFSNRVVKRIVWLSRLCFVVALAAVVYLSLGPTDPLAVTNDFIPWDKARHYLAYLVLSGLALAAFANVPSVFIGLGLFALGLGVEVMQPAFDRSQSLFDLAANALGILTVLALVLIIAVRTRLQDQGK